MNQKQIIAIIISAVIIIAGLSVAFYFIFSNNEDEIEPIFKGGTLTQDETWSGAISLLINVDYVSIFTS